jgi:plastocyanin
MFSRIPVFMLAIIIFGSGVGWSAGSPVIDDYTKALDANDAAGMTAVVEKYKMYVPATIKKLLDEAVNPDTDKEKREESFYLAELIANNYKEQTGDVGPLIDVKKALFNSRLSPPVRSVVKDGLHIVEIPEAAGDEMNIFKPDNIIIKQGETVRWANHDKISHVFASMPLIGAGGIFVPNIDPKKSYDYKFDKPGEYYYICFIHRGMIGKVTVEGEGEEEEGKETPAEGGPAKDDGEEPVPAGPPTPPSSLGVN